MVQRTRPDILDLASSRFPVDAYMTPAVRIEPLSAPSAVAGFSWRPAQRADQVELGRIGQAQSDRRQPDPVLANMDVLEV